MFSTIPEKAMYERLIDYINKHAIFESSCQYGFGSGSKHLTIHATIEGVDKL